MTPTSDDVLQFLRDTVADLATRDDVARLEVAVARLDSKHDETREVLVRQSVLLEGVGETTSSLKAAMYGNDGVIVDVANLKQDAARQDRRYYQVLVPMIVAVAGAFFAVVFMLFQRWLF